MSAAAIAEDHDPEPGMHGIEVVVEFLRRAQASYELIEHRDTFAAVDEARVSRSALERMAKTVLLHDHGGFRSVVIPASERVDLHKARVLLGASRHLRLATDEEIQGEFPAFDAGALPPFGALLGTPEILDARLLDYRHVLCSGGDHRHALKVSPREIERLGRPVVADVCQAHRTVPEKEKLLTHQPEGDPTPATKKPAPRARATATARVRAEDDARRLEHVTQSLAAAQNDL